MAINFGQIAGSMQKREDWYGQKRESLADKFAAWRQQNPYATQEQMQTYINQISGGNEYIAGGAPDSAGLASIAKNNLAEKNFRDKGRRLDNVNVFNTFMQNNPNATLDDLNKFKLQLAGNDANMLEYLPSEEVLKSIVEQKAKDRDIKNWNTQVENFNTQQKLINSITPLIENDMRDLSPNSDFVKARQNFLAKNSTLAGLLQPQDGAIGEFSLENVYNKEVYEDLMNRLADENSEKVLNYLKASGPDVVDKVTAESLMTRFNIGKEEANRVLSGAKKKYLDYKAKVEREFTQEVSDQVMTALNDPKITPQAALDFVKARYPKDDPLLNSLMQDTNWTKDIIAEATRLRNLAQEKEQGTFFDMLRMEAERLAEKPFMKPDQILETITQRAKLNKTMLASFGDDFNLTTFLAPIHNQAKEAYKRNEALRKQEITRQWDTDVRNVIKEDLARFIRNNNLDAATRLIENKIKSTLLPEVQGLITQQMKDDLISEIQGNMQQDQETNFTAKNTAAQTAIAANTGKFQQENIDKAVKFFGNKQGSKENLAVAQATEDLASKFVMDDATLDVIQTLVADGMLDDADTMAKAKAIIEPLLRGYSNTVSEQTSMMNDALLAQSGGTKLSTFTDYAEREKSLFQGQRQKLSALLEQVSQITDPRVRLRKMEDLAVRWKKNAGSYMTQLNAERRVAEGDGGWLLAGTGAYDDSLIESMNDDISFMDNVIKQQITQAKADVESGDYMGRPQLPTQVLSGDGDRNSPKYVPDLDLSVLENKIAESVQDFGFNSQYEIMQQSFGTGTVSPNPLLSGLSGWASNIIHKIVTPEGEYNARQLVQEFTNDKGVKTWLSKPENREVWNKFKVNPIETIKNNPKLRKDAEELGIELPE